MSIVTLDSDGLTSPYLVRISGLVRKNCPGAAGGGPTPRSHYLFRASGRLSIRQAQALSGTTVIDLPPEYATRTAVRASLQVICFGTAPFSSNRFERFRAGMEKHQFAFLFVQSVAARRRNETLTD